MLVEQAFMALPERLAGDPYLPLTHEHGMLPAFMLGLLEELNSRNVRNPAAALCSEREYEPGNSRRADLYLDLAPLGVLNAALQQYGFQVHNWIEAKFFRLNAAGDPSSNPSINTFRTLSDIIRLSTLVPVAHNPTVSRYFLHIYQNDPAQHVVLNRNVAGAPRAARDWLPALWTPGISTVDIRSADSAAEPAGFDTHVGNALRALDMTLTVKNWVLTPPSPKDPGFFCYLTHILRGAASIQGHSFSFTETVHRDHTPNATAQVRDIALNA